MPLRRSRLCIGNTRGAACTFSAETIGEPRGVFDPQQRCYFCDPALQRDASDALRPWLVGALTELFVLDTDIYAKALSLIAFRPGEDEPEIRRRVRARLSTLAVASRSFSAQQIKQAHATTALHTMLRECAEGHETQRAIRNAGREIARVEPLRKVLKEQLALTLSYLSDIDGLTDRLRLAQAEVKRIGYGLARNPAFLVSTGRPTSLDLVQAQCYRWARVLHSRYLRKLQRSYLRFFMCLRRVQLLSASSSIERALALIDSMLRAPRLVPGGVICAINFQPIAIP